MMRQQQHMQQQQHLQQHIVSAYNSHMPYQAVLINFKRWRAHVQYVLPWTVSDQVVCGE
jgi:hypothetical protein